MIMKEVAYIEFYLRLPRGSVKIEPLPPTRHNAPQGTAWFIYGSQKKEGLENRSFPAIICSDKEIHPSELAHLELGKAAIAGNL